MWWSKKETQWDKAKRFYEENDRYVWLGVLVGGLLLLSRPRFWRRIPNAENIPVSHLQRKKFISGVVSRVGDGDGFHIYHRPFLHNFFPLPKKILQSQISIRIAGVDAPECAHFGAPAQPFGEEAKKFLEEQIKGKEVRVQLLKRDQYGRCVGMAWVKRTFVWENVSSMLLKHGYATVYVGAGAEYGNLLPEFESIEKHAKKKKIGMWKKKSSQETPMEFKKRNKGDA